MTPQKLTKCSFCKYFSGKTCMAKPDSWYCTEALNEYYAYLRTKQPRQPQQAKPKGKYPWK